MGEKLYEKFIQLLFIIQQRRQIYLIGWPDKIPLIFRINQIIFFLECFMDFVNIGLCPPLRYPVEKFFINANT